MLQDAVVAEAVAGCHAVGPAADPRADRLPAAVARTRARLPGRLGPIVLATVERLRPIGADILKLQFPRDRRRRRRGGLVPAGSTRRAATRPGCCSAAGGDAAGFERDVEVACRAGASGFIAGRTLWQAALGLEGDALVARLAVGVRAARAAPARARRGARPAVAARRSNGAQPPADWWSATEAQVRSRRRARVGGRLLPLARRCLPVCRLPAVPSRSSQTACSNTAPSSSGSRPLIESSRRPRVHDHAQRAPRIERLVIGDGRRDERARQRAAIALRLHADRTGRELEVARGGGVLGSGGDLIEGQRPVPSAWSSAGSSRNALLVRVMRTALR